MATLSLLAGLLLCFPIPGIATYKEDIGFTELLDELRWSLPTGSGVIATQVEARTSYGTPLGPYMPTTADSQFTGKTINKMTSDSVGTYSSHALTVGRNFYGTASSLSPAVGTIDCYEANDWMGLGFLESGVTYLGKPIQPFYLWPSVLASPSRVGNHSYVGTASTSDILRRLDFVIETDEFIQVVAPDNASSNKPLLISSFNAITVGRSDGSHQRGSVAVDAVYTAGRTRPDLVVPNSPTSYAAPLAASSVALLLEKGRESQLAADPNRISTTNRNGIVIYNGERSEVIKASLMAGADRVTHNSSFANITDYRVAPGNKSSNGLDVRFGSGQLSIYHSYHIIASGEQNSAEDAGGGGDIGWYGFDYDPAFGGTESNSAASYFFTGDQVHRMLYASLVWNIDIAGGTWNDFNSTATLYNLDLQLHDVTDTQDPRLVAASRSTVDNTENLWVPLSPGRSYRLQVVPGQGQAPFQWDWDYALAWRMVTPPDSDGDKMPDDWEVYFGLDHTNPADATVDLDADTLDNDEEYANGTDPTDTDTDGDGFMDGYEVSSGYDPLDPGSQPQAPEVPAMDRSVFFLAACLMMLAGVMKVRPKSSQALPASMWDSAISIFHEDRSFRFPSRPERIHGAARNRTVTKS